jgi:hypothetical protein
MTRKFVVTLMALPIAAFVVACGGSETTTVIEQQSETPPLTVTETTPAAPPAPAPAAQPPAAKSASQACENPPDVVGLTLPAAKKELSEAGCRADVSNTDTTFGIIVESNYTVCTQDDPISGRVPILAQKYGC